MATQAGILAGKFHGQRSLAGYSPVGRTQSDMTESLSTHADTAQGNITRREAVICFILEKFYENTMHSQRIDFDRT